MVLSGDVFQSRERGVRAPHALTIGEQIGSIPRLSIWHQNSDSRAKAIARNQLGSLSITRGDKAFPF